MMRRRTSLPKPSARVPLVHVDDVAAGNAQAVAHAVIAREIGRGLGRRHDVICRQRVFGVRQRDVDGLGAGVFEPIARRAATASRFQPACRRIRYSFGMPMRMPLTGRADDGFVVRHRHDRRRSCPWGHGPPSSAAGSRNRARCAQTARPDRARRQTPRCPSASSARRSALVPTIPLNAAGWRIEPPVSVAGRAERTAAPRPPPPIRPMSRRGRALRRRARAARHGDDDRPEAGRFVRRAHGELIVVELAEQHRAVAPEIAR